MAPLPLYLSFRKVLLFSFLVSTLLTCFFFVFTTSHSHSHSQNPQNFLGRRNLLGKNDIDFDDDNDDYILLDVVPRKKKASSISSDAEKDDTFLIKKKKSSSSDEEILPKKKKDEEVDQTPKKKKSITTLEDDEIKQAQKKKKSSSLQEEDELLQLSKKKKSISTPPPPSSSTKNQTKIIKPKTPNSSKKDETKSSHTLLTISKHKLKKLNSTSKPANSTKSTTKKSIDLLKTDSTAKNKTKSSSSETLKPNKSAKSSSSISDTADKKKSQSQNPSQKLKNKSSPTSWMMYQDVDEEEEDLVSEFRDLPTKFHQSFIPDLHRISTTSKVYLNKYNKEITKGFKPYVGNKYATSVATAISCVFIIVPFLLVTLVFNRIKAYFSLQKLIIFIQIYLSIYFSILAVSSLITGLEPLRFFYATSQNTYVWLQVLQTLAYVLYLLLLLMYLVLVFSTSESDLGQKFLGLGQTLVGFSVGLHYYMTVFHRVVLRQPPKTNWKIHGIYATCFLVVICLFARAERKKKAYLVEGSEQGKTS